MRRLVATLLALGALAALAGCGSGSEGASAEAAIGGTRVTQGPYLYDMPGVVRTLRRQGIDARRAATGRAYARFSLPAAARSARFVAQGTPFTLLLYSSEDIAGDAVPSLEGKANGNIVIGKNLVGIVERRGQGYQRVLDALIGLGSNPPGPEPREPQRGEPLG